MPTEKSAVSLQDIYAPIEPRFRYLLNTILEIIASPNELAGEVIRYFFSSQGKFLRPALAFLGAEVKRFSSSSNVNPRAEDFDNRLLRLAAAFEIFHSATLIHDDIIDSAYIRRHIPTLNVKWGPEIAVLMGDFLYERASRTIYYEGDEKIISLFLQTAGIVCDGGIHEMKEKDNFNLTEEEYFEIISKKTAEFLACCVEAGGLLGGATPEEAVALKNFGRNFGMAFQIMDDCLDFMGREQEFGKTLGADCATGVLTLPLIRLIQLVDEKRKSEVFKIFKSEMGTYKFQTLRAMISESGSIEYALDKARGFSEKARLELSIFPASPAKKSLEQLLDYVIERNK